MRQPDWSEGKNVFYFFIRAFFFSHFKQKKEGKKILCSKNFNDDKTTWNLTKIQEQKNISCLFLSYFPGRKKLF